MNPEKRRPITGTFADPNVAYAEQEVVAFDSAGHFCKLSDPDAQGIAGFTGRAFHAADVNTSNPEVLYTGYLDLINDSVSPIGLQHLRGLADIYFVDGLTVTSDPARSCNAALTVDGLTLAEGGTYVTINVAPPGAS